MLRLRDTSASGGGPELDWLLTMLDCEIALRAGDTERARMTIDAAADDLVPTQYGIGLTAENTSVLLLPTVS